MIPCLEPVLTIAAGVPARSSPGAKALHAVEDAPQIDVDDAPPAVEVAEHPRRRRFRRCSSAPPPRRRLRRPRPSGARGRRVGDVDASDARRPVGDISREGGVGGLERLGVASASTTFMPRRRTRPPRGRCRRGAGDDGDAAGLQGRDGEHIERPSAGRPPERRRRGRENAATVRPRLRAAGFRRDFGASPALSKPRRRYQVIVSGIECRAEIDDGSCLSGLSRRRRAGSRRPEAAAARRRRISGRSINRPPGAPRRAGARPRTGLARPAPPVSGTAAGTPIALPPDADPAYSTPVDLDPRSTATADPARGRRPDRGAGGNAHHQHASCASSTCRSATDAPSIRHRGRPAGVRLEGRGRDRPQILLARLDAAPRNARPPARPADPSRRQPGNPLGARALYLFEDKKDTLFRIHGTNDPTSIGHAVSSGCIRMINVDVIDLYGRVAKGTKVVVL